MHNLCRGQKWPNKLGYFGNFQKPAQSKQSPNKRKFAQSGLLDILYDNWHHAMQSFKLLPHPPADFLSLFEDEIAILERI
jgi:hypothetical protein